MVNHYQTDPRGEYKDSVALQGMAEVTAELENLGEFQTFGPLYFKFCVVANREACDCISWFPLIS